MQLKEKEKEEASQPNPYQNIQWTALSPGEIANVCAINY